MPHDEPRLPEGGVPDLDRFADLVMADDGYILARHHRMLVARLAALAEGKIDRLMVLMPPGSAKSTYCSIVFPVWFLARFPGSAIIAASHTADLAKHFARHARSMIDAREDLLGYRLERGERAVTHWTTTARGQYFATGVRGPIAGRRADLAIIDDPVRSATDADSARLRGYLWDWYCSDLITRLKPGGRVMLVMTRWHPDDLAGRLLARRPGEWSVLRLPALAEANDPLGRQPGDPLWPEWETEAHLLRKRDEIGERSWQSLFQQSPRLSLGALFKVERIAVLDVPPAIAGGRIARGWDLAATADTGRNDPDWTAGVKILQEASGRLVVLDVIRARTTPLEVEQTLLAVARADGRSVKIGIPEDPGQAGKAQAAAYRRKLLGHVVDTSRETGSKESRSRGLVVEIESGNVAMMRAPWNQDFIEELRDFPHGRKDDQVDAANLALKLLIGAENSTRSTNVSIMHR